jgi:hypothetical protein
MLIAVIMPGLWLGWQIIVLGIAASDLSIMSIFTAGLVAAFILPVWIKFNQACNLIHLAKEAYVKDLKKIRYSLINKSGFSSNHDQIYSNLNMMINFIEDHDMKTQKMFKLIDISPRSK